jgi:uncharacterized protein
LAKLVVDEQESAALAVAVDNRNLASSVVASVELRLMARKSGAARAPAIAEEVLDAVDLIDLTDELTRSAGRLKELRALDAIHLASALSLEPDLDGFVVYDRRLGRAAADAGLAVLAPR